MLKQRIKISAPIFWPGCPVAYFNRDSLEMNASAADSVI